MKIVSVPDCRLSVSWVLENDVRPLTVVLNVDASELVSTSAVSGLKPDRPSAVSVLVRSMPAFSSVVVGALMLAMDVTQ